jgi:hypothetical protein
VSPTFTSDKNRSYLKKTNLVSDAMKLSIFLSVFTNSTIIDSSGTSLNKSASVIGI